MNKKTIPSWIRFADHQSESNFKKALVGGKNQLGRNPFVIISGPPGSGKSTLGRLLLEGLYGDAFVTRWPKSEAGWERLLPCLAGKQYLFFDNLYGDIYSQSLMNLVSSGDFEYRKLYTHKMKRVSLDMMVVITGNGLNLDADIALRAWFVGLDVPEEKCNKNAGAVGEGDVEAAEEAMVDRFWEAYSGTLSMHGIHLAAWNSSGVNAHKMHEAIMAGLKAVKKGCCCE